MYLVNNFLESICASKFEFGRVILEYITLCVEDNNMPMIKGSGHSREYDD